MWVVCNIQEKKCLRSPVYFPDRVFWLAYYVLIHFEKTNQRSVSTHGVGACEVYARALDENNAADAMNVEWDSELD